jgi:peroxin-13
MIAVAEQFGNLRDTLGSVLGIFAIIRWIRTLFAKLTGRPPPADVKALTPANFAHFEGRKVGPNGVPAGPPRASRKPLIFFVLAAFGLPYLMTKVIRAMTASHEEEQKRLAAAGGQTGVPIDPTKLEYCRLLYDYTPNPNTSTEDLAARKGDLVAVLRKTDPFGTPIDWWQCRTRDGRTGYLPSTYLEKLNVKLPQQQPAGAIKATAASDGSRANSLTSSGVTVETIPGPPTPAPVEVPRAGMKPGDLALPNPMINH